MFQAGFLGKMKVKKRKVVNPIKKTLKELCRAQKLKLDKEKAAKIRKFRPHTIPRYLPGEVPHAQIMADLKKYNEHRFNVFMAKAMTDLSPPKMLAEDIIDKRRLKEDKERLEQIDKENKDLLSKINTINRNGGKVDTWNEKAYDRSFSKWSEHEYKELRIVKANKKIYRRIIRARSAYSKASHDKFWNSVLTKLKFTCKYPLVILERPNYDGELQRQPSISDRLEIDRVARPICFMSFKVDHGMKLGSVFFQLYSDYVPVTCQNFLALIKGEVPDISYKNSIIHNIVKYEYFELGDITCGNGKGGKSIFGDKFAEENFSLKHARGGVLSMIPVGNHENNSQFSITLKPMSKFDGKRVVFGKIVKGFETILKINDLGKKVGKPGTPVRIIACGECSKKFIKKMNKEFRKDIRESVMFVNGEE